MTENFTEICGLVPFLSQSSDRVTENFPEICPKQGLRRVTSRKEATIASMSVNHTVEATNPFSDEGFKARWRAHQMRQNEKTKALRAKQEMGSDALLLSNAIVASDETSDRSSMDTMPSTALDESVPSDAAQRPGKIPNRKPEEPRRSGLHPGDWKTLPRRGEIMAKAKEIVESPEGRREVERLRELRRARAKKEAREEPSDIHLGTKLRTREWVLEASRHLKDL